MNETRTIPTRAGQWFLVLMVCLLAVTACGGDSRNAHDANVLHRGNGDEPESLDVHLAASAEAGDVQRDLGEGLLSYTPDGKLTAGAAERWAVSADAREYRFWLRPEARWSNGDAVTAADFVFGFQRLVDPATAALNAQMLVDIDGAAEILRGARPPASLGVSAQGKHEFVIRLEKPVPYFLNLLTHPSTFPVHRASVEAHGAAHARPGNLVSNGAYRLVAWEIGSQIELERNEHYWNNAATAIDRVIHHVTPQPMAELNRYRAGELHTTRTIPPGAFKQMQAERPDEVRVSRSMTIYYYGFNMTKPKFANNPKLREALSLAIDRDFITAQIVGRGEAPAYSWVPPGMAGYEARHLPYARLDQAARSRRAQELYSEAGYSNANPLQFELRYNTSDVQQSIAVAIQAMWRDVLGAEVTLQNEDFQVLLDNIRQGETEMFRLSWIGDYVDPQAFLKIFLSDEPSNLTSYVSADFDKLMRDAGAQTDPEHRFLILGEAERTVLSDHPAIPIYFYVNKSMVSPRVRGWGDNVMNYHYSQHLSLTPEP